MDPASVGRLRAGVVIDGKYRVDRVLGRGAMGVVVAATHVTLGERVALKFLRTRDDDTGGDYQVRFAREARVCAKLKNDHIARVHDVGTWEGTIPFMVMDYVQGIELQKELKALGRIPLIRAVDFAFQICEAVAEAHALGIVHRDLKPANILITTRPDGSELLKVLDFGISKWSAEDEFGELTKAGTMLGSPKYMAPEQLMGGDIDARADVWSIGAILYATLTGRPAYDGAHLHQLLLAIASGVPPLPASTFATTIPPALDALLLRCLTHDREKRVSSVAELGEALLEAVGATVPEPPSPLSTAKHFALVVESAVPTSMPSSRPPETMGRRRRIGGAWLASIGAVVSIAIGVAGAPGLLSYGEAPSWMGARSARVRSLAAKRLAPELQTSLAVSEIIDTGHTDLPREGGLVRWVAPAPAPTTAAPSDSLLAAITASLRHAAPVKVVGTRE